MPVCDGRQVFEMIRADEEIKNIPVVFLTGVNDREHIEPILAMRPAGYVLKPLDKKLLLEKIKIALDAARRVPKKRLHHHLPMDDDD
jgi:CheY-like chemotaxis protein